MFAIGLLFINLSYRNEAAKAMMDEMYKLLLYI